MRLSAKSLVRGAISAAGYTINRSQGGIDAFDDIRLLTRSDSKPLIIDVGANVGQSVDRFKAIFPNAEIHSFEPSPSTFETLQRRVGAYQNVHLNNFGLGNEPAQADLFENTHSDMSSLLPLGQSAWGTILKKTPVRIETLDAYAAAEKLDVITVLKTDTQGYDLNVIRGATELIEQHRIRMIYTELIFSDMYKGSPAVDEVLRFMRLHGLQLVKLYDFHLQEDVASWADALFIDTASLG